MQKMGELGAGRGAQAAVAPHARVFCGVGRAKCRRGRAAFRLPLATSSNAASGLRIQRVPFLCDAGNNELLYANTSSRRHAPNSARLPGLAIDGVETSGLREVAGG
jgi:hypothetical protein